MDSDRLFRFKKPEWLNSLHTRTAGVYVAGALFSLGFFLFIDAATFSKTNVGSKVHVTFVDWVPGICSSLGMLVINLINKATLQGDSWSFGGSSDGTAWKARLFLFIGFALMAGGLAGSVTVFVVKYLIPDYGFPPLWYGVANVAANGSIMLSSAVLWVFQNMDDEYTYSLAL